MGGDELAHQQEQGNRREDDDFDLPDIMGWAHQIPSHSLVWLQSFGPHNFPHLTPSSPPHVLACLWCSQASSYDPTRPDPI